MGKTKLFKILTDNTVFFVATFFYFLFLFLFSIFFTQSVFAAPDTCTWTGSIDNTWSNGGNWSGCDNGGVPESGDELLFPNGASNINMNNDLVGLVLHNVYFNGDNYSLTGNTFTVTNVFQFNGNNNQINVAFSFSAASSTVLYNGIAATGNLITTPINLNITAGDFNIYNHNLTDPLYIPEFTGSTSGNFNIFGDTAVGYGTIISSTSASTFTTGGAVNIGTRFECRHNDCLGASTNSINIVPFGSEGGYLVLDMSVHVNYASFFLLNSNSGVRSITTKNGVTGSITGPITLLTNPISIGAGMNGDLNIYSTINLNNFSLVIGGHASQETWYYGSGISGNGNLIVGAGVLYLGTPGSNSFVGNVNILSGGRLDINNMNSLGAAGNSVIISSNGCMTVSSAINIVNSVIISVMGSNGNTSLGCNGAIEVKVPGVIFTGTIIGVGINPTISLINIVNNASLDFNGSLNVNESATINIGTNSSINFNPPSNIFTFPLTTLTFNGTGSSVSSANLYSTNILGDGHIELNNVDSMNTAVTTTFNGNIYLNGDTIMTAGDTNLGTTVGNTYVSSGAILRSASSSVEDFYENIYISGTGHSSGFYAGGAFFNEGQAVNFYGNIVLLGNTTFVNRNGTSSSINFFGPITGSYDLTLKASNPSSLYFNFNGTSVNAYNKTILDGAFLQLNKTGGLGIPGDVDVMANTSYTAGLIVNPTYHNQIYDGSIINLQNSGMNQASFLSFSQNEVIGTLIGNGFIDSTGAVTDGFTIGGANLSGTFTGTVSSLYAMITKTGTGTWTLNGVTQVGAGSGFVYIVNDGTLMFNSNIANAAVTLNSSSILKGTGTINTLTSTGTSTFAPGTSPGCMSLGSLTLSSSSTYEVEINGITPCTQYDQTTVTPGPIVLGGANLNVVLGFTPTIGNQFLIIDGSSPISDTFGGLPNGSTFVSGVTTFRVRYNYPNPGDVTLEVVDPVPLAPTGDSQNTVIVASLGLISLLSLLKVLKSNNEIYSIDDASKQK